MLARFRVLLPVAFNIPFDAKLETVSFDFKGYRATIYPPTQANVDSSVADVTSDIPFLDAIANLDAAILTTPTKAIKVNGKETIKANLLQIDFIGIRDFDRPRGVGQTDPPVDLFFELANKLIQKIRSLGSLPNVRILTTNNALGWRIEYLTDEGNQLEKDPEKSRSVQSGVTRWRTNVITQELWKIAAQDFCDFEPYVWDSLLLDAHAQPDDINAAIVLANAALESAIDFVLEVLAREAAIPQYSSNWLINRSGDYIRQPSLKEKFSELLFLLSGHSLERDDKDLWESFIDLKNARNSIVHKGKAVLKKGKKTAERQIDASLGKELLGKTKEIIDWLEALLPDDARREKLKSLYQLSFNVNARGSDEKEMYLVGVKSSDPLDLALFPIDD